MLEFQIGMLICIVFVCIMSQQFISVILCLLKQCCNILKSWVYPSVHLQVILGWWVALASGREGSPQSTFR